MNKPKYEIVATNQQHPDIKGGQHTNGPAPIWVREPGGSWYKTPSHHMHKVKQELAEHGLTRIINKEWNGR